MQTPCFAAAHVQLHLSEGRICAFLFNRGDFDAFTAHVPRSSCKMQARV